MQIYELTKPELDMFRELCNFTPDELIYFNERANYKTHLQISLAHCWSESSESWTDEMKEAARKKALERRNRNA